MPLRCDAMPVLLQINLEGITARALDSFKADIWLMSPPCQPFTRRGLQLHAADRRSASFAHLLELLPSLKVKPSAGAHKSAEQCCRFTKGDSFPFFLLRFLPQSSALYNYQSLLSSAEEGMSASFTRFLAPCAASSIVCLGGERRGF